MIKSRLYSGTAIVVFAVLLFPRIAAAGQNRDDLPLIEQEDLLHLGAFRVPRGTSEADSFDYGGTAIAFNPGNNSLFLVGHGHHKRTAEISIPELSTSGNVHDLNTAELIQDFADPTAGQLNSINPSNRNPQKIGGQLVYGDRLIVTGFSTYDGRGTQSSSHFSRSLSLSDSENVTGPTAVGSSVHRTSGYMTIIPSDWQESMGGPALTGNCCRSIISNHSFGPAVSAFDPRNVEHKDHVPATDLLYYTSSDPLGTGGSTQNDLFNLTTRVEGVVFPNGTRSVLFFGSHGVGKYCYGTGKDCDDPAKSAKGTHAYPYVYQVWAYDATDLEQVRKNRKRPYRVLPYAVWTLALPFESDNAHFIGGTAYDPVTGRIYLSQLRTDGKKPIIHVLTVKKP